MLTSVSVPSVASGAGSAYVKFPHPASRSRRRGRRRGPLGQRRQCLVRKRRGRGRRGDACAGVVRRGCAGGLGPGAAARWTPRGGGRGRPERRPMGDVFASAEYRRAMAAVYVRRALGTAASRAAEARERRCHVERSRNISRGRVGIDGTFPARFLGYARNDKQGPCHVERSRNISRGKVRIDGTLPERFLGFARNDKEGTCHVERSRNISRGRVRIDGTFPERFLGYLGMTNRGALIRRRSAAAPSPRGRGDMSAPCASASDSRFRRTTALDETRTASVPASVDELQQALRGEMYVADRALAMSVYLR